MKFILEKNFLTEVEEITKEDIKESVIYTGKTKKGEDIKVYDKENGKIAPIVRYLIEGNDNRKISIWLLILAIFIFIIIFVVGYFIFFNKATPTKTQPTPQTPINTSTEKIIKPATTQEEEKQEEEKKPDDFEIQVQNEIQTLRDLKQASDLEVFDLQFLIKEKDFEINKLTKENEFLLLEDEKNKKIIEDLTAKIENSKKGAGEEFLLFLGSKVAGLCEKTEREQLCKDLYYNFIKGIENQE